MESLPKIDHQPCKISGTKTHEPGAIWTSGRRRTFCQTSGDVKKVLLKEDSKVVVEIWFVNIF